jgi:hypothetical protein
MTHHECADIHREGADIFASLLEDYEVRGRGAIEGLRKKSPGSFVLAVVAMLDHELVDPDTKERVRSDLISALIAAAERRLMVKRYV